MRTSVYVHFPWCAKKCPYCDFATTKRSPDAIPHEAYADAIIAELGRRGPFPDRTLHSIFFGGGTPSLWLGRSVERVRIAITEAFDKIDADLEVTAECNPASLTEDVVAAFSDAGINRLSVGIQSLRNDQLQFLGRLHDREMALGALARASARFSRVSADLMFGMANQRTISTEIAAVLETGVRHVSAYALTIESGTQFGERYRLGKLPVSSDDRYASLYEEAESRFADAGFAHYEVSNYAKEGERSLHNLHYWRGGDYLGLGAAAVGCLSDGLVAHRYKNTLDAAAYMSSVGSLAEEETLDANARVQEAFMLGLRISEGVDLESLAKRVQIDPLAGRQNGYQRRLESGDLIHEGNQLRVPSNRWLFLDGIVADLF